ncbi:YihY/virulence factor BrkB family protein [Streptomyces sp. NBC_01808]|uniref:YihY/virulence factor BrkB family protein n=1 Tax=Streptomyces sp. NBC_01808 TaxID=2975947 RepID=UPI002DD7CE05|nr:YihY/virulence factor BrkB family protein [Streptomyces sp. NBC_01808]WSA38838.1 YihY/virulence factor BrkB family protein [Streptomyces sp. NBC_01808]
MKRGVHARGRWANGARYRAALRRTPVALWNDDISDWAAALTYYAILTVLPTLFVTLTVIGLADPSGTEALIAYIAGLAPTGTDTALNDALHDVTRGHSTAWILTTVGTASAVWSACSFLSVFRRALHAMYGTSDSRPVLRRAPAILAMALLLLTLLVSGALTLVVTGPGMRALGRPLGMGEQTAALWDFLRWPFLVFVAALLVLLLFRSGPPESRAVSHAVPGGLLAGVLWLLASVGFAMYASYAAGTYSRLYGSLAGVVVFLIWLWFSNLALLAGAQFNALLARGEDTPEAARPPRRPAVPAVPR